MGVGRILHAVTPVNPNTKRWDLIYKPASPFALLVSYWYMQGKRGIEALKNMRRLAGLKTLAVDCGIYSLKSEFGMTAQTKVTEAQIRLVRQQAEQKFDKLKEYVIAYGCFLRDSYDLYDYALDFDSDTILSAELTDRLRDILFEVAGKQTVSKIASVYHVGTRPNARAWWTNICKDPRFNYVAIEGGQMHRSTPQFYLPLIEEAHRYGKKVHVLAISGATFPMMIPADYMDASTHSMGGQKALIQTPWGTFQAGRYLSQRHILAQSRKIQEATREFVKTYGFILEQLMDYDSDAPNIDAQYYRQQLSIKFIDDYWDVPYELPKLSTGRLF